MMNTDKISISLTDHNFQREVLESNLPVLVEFGTDWCGPCHIMAPMMESLFWDFNGQVKITKLDIDKYKKIAEKYGVLDLPTILFFKDGRQVNHVTGTVPKIVIENILNEILQTEVNVC